MMTHTNLGFLFRRKSFLQNTKPQIIILGKILCRKFTDKAKLVNQTRRRIYLGI